MNNTTFAKFYKISRAKNKNTDWFKAFLDNKPTRRQFNKIMMRQVIMPDHFWFLSGRK